MVRTLAAGLLITCMSSGCANLQGASFAGYCLTGSGGGCSARAGDCGPCADTVTNGEKTTLSPDVARQRLP
jgi:hypothetical protein